MVPPKISAICTCVDERPKRWCAQQGGGADLLLLVPCGEYGALGLEFKTPIGRQSPAQKAWQAAFETAGNRYAVVRSVEEAIAITNDYLNSGVM